MLLDKLILRPTRKPLGGTQPTKLIDCGDSTIELWVHQVKNKTNCSAASRDLFVIRLIGATGRAENATLHPFEAWPDLSGEFWVGNPPGFGQSSGRASLMGMLDAARSTFRHARAESGDAPILLVGSSLGAATALALAAEEKVDGLLLRDPPDLRRVIVHRYGKWTCWLPTIAFASRVPRDVGALLNARRCNIPAVFVTSGADRIVPYGCQQLVLQAYGGPFREVHLPAAGHGEPVTNDQHDEYSAALDWLRNQIGLNLVREAELR